MQIYQRLVLGLVLDILKRGSWNHMGCTANMLKKDINILRPLKKHTYFADGMMSSRALYAIIDLEE